MKELEEFIKGEYVVVLEDRSETNNWTNWCFKIGKKHGYLLCPEKTINGNINNVNNANDHESYNCLDKCRYATLEEIEFYDKYDKPFNITEVELTPIVTESLIQIL